MNYHALLCHFMAGMSWVSNPLLGACWTLAGFYESYEQKRIREASFSLMKKMIMEDSPTLRYIVGDEAFDRVRNKMMK